MMPCKLPIKKGYLMSTGLEYIDFANSVDIKAAAKCGFRDEDTSNIRISEGLYRVGSLIAYGDGMAKDSDIEDFITMGIRDNGYIETASVYLPTDDFIEDQLQYTYYGNGEADFIVPLTSLPDNKWSHAFRFHDGNWVVISIFRNLASNAQVDKTEAIRMLGDIAAYNQARHMNVLRIGGLSKHYIGTLFEHYWYQLATAKLKDRPSICRNCGRLMKRSNAKGNTQKSCGLECTTQFNNELKRLKREIDRNNHPIGVAEGGLEAIAWRCHEARPLLFAGRPSEEEIASWDDKPESP